MIPKEKSKCGSESARGQSDSLFIWATLEGKTDGQEIIKVLPLDWWPPLFYGKENNFKV